MRKPGFFIGLAACFLSFYALGLYSPWRGSGEAPVSENARPGLPQAVRATGNPGITAPAPGTAAAKEPVQAVAESQGAELYDFLHNGNGLGPFAHLYPALESRFAQAYPAGEPAQRDELVSRIGLLEALESGYASRLTHVEQSQLLQFYLNVGENEQESSAVRRQAWRNIGERAAALDEEERMSLLARFPEELVASASKTKREVLLEAFDESP